MRRKCTDSLIYWNLLAGGGGGIAGCANVYPGTMTAIYERFMQGDLEGLHSFLPGLLQIRKSQYNRKNRGCNAGVSRR